MKSGGDGMGFVSEKVSSLPAYLFSEFQRKKQLLKDQGKDVIDLGIGAPDLTPPSFVIEELHDQSTIPSNHRYSIYGGSDSFKEAVAYFYQTHYNVHLDPKTEILTLIGSKEGIVNLVQAVINPGDHVLVPDPGYPVYNTAVTLAGGKRIFFPLNENNGYTPDFISLNKTLNKRVKMMFLNYPSNPTAATVELETFKEAVAFAKKHQILLAHDAAYDLINFGNYKAPSILQVSGAKEVAVELGSLSKSFNMTGWRIGYAVGNKEVIKALATLKSNMDTSQFLPIQLAAARALKSDLQTVKQNNKIYHERMEVLHKGFMDLGFDVNKPRGTIFLWMKVPSGFTSASFADLVLEKAAVIVTPGVAFGENGEGYVRIAVTVGKERLEEVLDRLQKINFRR